MYYIQKDYLGSFYCITGEDGDIIVLNDREEQIYSFDPWGRRRKAYNWEYYDYKTTYLFDRGFTGHEHMDKFDLINMNGRCYDPRLSRMLSPDPFVQSPTYSQNFNRYSYAFNNPLKYTDPSGYIEKPIIHENRYSAGGGGGNYFGSNMYFGNPFSGGGAGTNGFYYYSSATGGYMYGQAGFAGGTQVSYGEFSNNYVVPNATYSVTGYSAQSVFGNITSGFTLYEVQAFGQTTLVSAFGPLGSTNVSSNGGISFSNLTASAHAGEVVVGSTGGGDNSSSANLFLTGAFLAGLDHAAYTNFSTLGNIENAAARNGIGLNLLKQRAGAARLMYAAKGAGNFLGGLGIAYTGYQIYQGDISGVKGSFDIAFGVIGYMGPIGLGVSGIYFLGDAFIPGGWQAVPGHMYNQMQRNSHEGVWLSPYNHFK